ncbi:MAG: hypothetical protein A3H34_02810 [Betaproteobacteria bacterium RIFCSPLOWO2_02_FULL_67_19]|nr:MAG: hypothetical protein A3H34_02810 [Betaproteobacteria bacterium RIFCSPLOWO2_02_FULL_67_19]
MPQGFAQDRYPVRPIRLLIPFPPGGAADNVGRAIGERLSAQLKQPVVIDNRPGAAGRLATDLLVRAEPDGYTLLVGTPGAITIAPSLHKTLSYNVDRDILPITHVPYKGGGPALIDLISGDIQVMFSTAVVALPHVNSGRLRALAVITAQRQALLPNLPAMSETVPGFGISNWDGIFAPARTPPRIADRLFVEINKALQSAELRQRLNAAGIDPVGSASRADFVKSIRDETTQWAKVIKDANIKVD